jgi:hypothetical protein
MSNWLREVTMERVGVAATFNLVSALGEVQKALVSGHVLGLADTVTSIQ